MRVIEILGVRALVKCDEFFFRVEITLQLSPILEEALDLLRVLLLFNITINPLFCFIKGQKAALKFYHALLRVAD